MRPFPVGAAVCAAVVCLSCASAAAESRDLWLAIGPRKFESSIRPLVEHRRRCGYEARFVAIEEASAGEAATPGKIRDFIRAERDRSGGRLRFVLLAADAGPVKEGETGPWIPPALLEPRFKSKTIPCPDIIASDAFFGMMDDDQVPDAAVGRLPADSEEELAAMVAKILAYEGSSDFGEWRRKIDLVAGTGGFGQAADSMIELMFRKLLTDLLNPGFDVRLTYANPASPYCWPPPSFGAKVVDVLNEGSLFAAYVGHGSPDSFGTLSWEGRMYRIFEAESARKLSIRRGPPVMVIIACSTGHFDHPDFDCVSETLIRKADGPVAVFSSTRISHPYSNGLIAKELIASVLSGKHAALGTALDEVRKSLLTHEPDDLNKMIDGFARMFMQPADLKPNREDHVHLYTLFGDPATRIQFPGTGLKLEAPAASSPGGLVEVKAAMDRKVSGRARLSIEVQRGVLKEAVLKPEGPGALAAMEKNWAKANDSVLVSADVEFKDGAISAVLKIPSEGVKEGRHVVKVYAEFPGGSAMGSSWMEVVLPAGEEEYSRRD